MTAALPGEPVLPALRQELELRRGAPGTDGAPVWLIYDPVRHAYIEVNTVVCRLVALWHGCPTRAALRAAARERYGFTITEGEVDELIGFLHAHHLTVEPAKDGWRRLAAEEHHRRTRRGPLASLFHSYVFFRIPLVRPEPFLRATLPMMRLLASWPALALAGLAGLIGLYLVSRQWDQFLATASYAFTLEGALVLGLALVAVKALHELGHAYVAIHYRCAVPTLGIAFFLLTPLPYCDVTDAWRLTERRQRLRIDAAGVAVELWIAMLATFAWAFLPDGPWRSAAFFLATAGWLLSIAVNLNPLMRFDGYYLLADLLKIDNLQTRAFAFGRWQLREVLFALGEPPPEPITVGRRRALIIYAWGVWAYRLVLFLGIALLVYANVFKALGLTLLVAAIAYFIAGPIMSEIKAWWPRRGAILRSPRAWLVAAGTAAGIAALAVPWPATVMVPALIEPGEVYRVFPPRAARVAEVWARNGLEVAAADPLVRLEVPDIALEQRRIAAKLALVRTRLARGAGFQGDRDDRLVLEHEERALEARLAGLAQETAALTVRAPLAGSLIETEPTLAPGRWIARNLAIASLRAGPTLRARGYLDEAAARRVKPGGKGRFIPDDVQRRPVAVVLADVAPATSGTIEIAALAAPSGGPIAVDAQRDGRLVPNAAHFLASFVVDGHGDAVSIDARMEVRGTIHLDAAPESVLTRMWRQIVRVLVREAGA